MMPSTSQQMPVAEVMQLPKARFEGDIFVIDEDTNEDEWKEIGHGLKWAARRVQFCLGDWLRFGEKKGFTGKYTDRRIYDQLEAITGLDRQTIKNIRCVSEKVPSTVRLPELSFSHHAEVASLPPKYQQRFLKLASEENLTVKQLRQRINGDEHKHMREITAKLDEQKELRTTFTKDEIQQLEAKVQGLLSEINSLPLIFRMKIKQGIRRKI